MAVTRADPMPALSASLAPLGGGSSVSLWARPARPARRTTMSTALEAGPVLKLKHLSYCRNSTRMARKNSECETGEKTQICEKD